MKKEIGLWIDHRKAVVVMVSDEGEEVEETTSHMEKRMRLIHRLCEYPVKSP